MLAVPAAGAGAAGAAIRILLARARAQGDKGGGGGGGEKPRAEHDSTTASSERRAARASLFDVFIPPPSRAAFVNYMTDNSSLRFWGVKFAQCAFLTPVGDLLLSAPCVLTPSGDLLLSACVFDTVWACSMLGHFRTEIYLRVTHGVAGLSGRITAGLAVSRRITAGFYCVPADNSRFGRVSADNSRFLLCPGG